MPHNRSMPSTPKSSSRSAEVPMLGLRERKKARTRKSIQQHALRLFLEHGYAETTVEQIAEAAEVSPSTFFRYFATKEEVVLTDFIDRQTFELMVSAPAELSPLQALRYAVEQTFGDLSREDLKLEASRNELIRSVPELRRGMIVELTRPIALLAEAIAVRLGRRPDDPDLQMYAGAAVGAMMTVTADTSPSDMHQTVAIIKGAVDRLERMLVLP